jgi:uronate dehydrogenase
MRKVLITGSNGTIGSVLRERLQHEVTDFDLPEHNAEQYGHVYEKAKGHDVLVHLAWDFESDGWLGDNLNPDNTQITYNIYQAAVDAGVKRVVMASSVHADKFVGHDVFKDGLLHPHAVPLPDSPYGAEKCFVESLGRYFADSKNLEVVCIRFGGVNKADQPPTTPESERQVWFSQRDCVNLVQTCIDAELADKFTVMYGVSDNAGRLHDLSNPFGWSPLDGAR